MFEPCFVAMANMTFITVQVVDNAVRGCVAVRLVLQLSCKSMMLLVLPACVRTGATSDWSQPFLNRVRFLPCHRSMS